MDNHPETTSATPVAFDDSPDYIQSLHRGLDVIRAFSRENPAMTLSEIAEITGLSRAVVRRVLLTLQFLGFVGQQGRQFYLSPRILELGFSYLSSLPFTDLALPFMEELAQQVHESCSLSVLDGSDIVYVQRVPVRKVMTISLGIGARLPAYCASMGRVLLAALDPTELALRLPETLPARTPHTLTSRSAVLREIAQVREQGFAYVEQELELGLCSLSVPVRDRNHRVIAALNIGMAFRTGARDRAIHELLPALRETASQIEKAMPNDWTRGKGHR
ncbi:helix-turn-helix domain-containing protein [Permianibacter sp. IMCC34836]|nr:helix-turn-helix domain-containing protein [Permianibacter fluminis]